MNILQSLNKKTLLFSLLVIILFVILLLLYIVKSKSNTPPSPQVIVTPIQKSTDINPSYKKNVFIPTYAPEKGSGVNLEAPLVADSIREIQKLYPFLPYEKIVMTPLSQEIAVVIPDFTSQPNRWTLQVYIFGLDYQLNKGDIEYEVNKNAFKTAFASLTSWIKEKGVDSKKIMIIWGDKEYIQNKSQEWLE